MGKASRKKQQGKRTPPPKWTPFERGYMSLNDAKAKAMVQDMVDNYGSTPEQALEILNKTLKDVVMVNSRYQVNINRYKHNDGGPDMVHLSIKRRDKEAVGVERFRDFQRIKNELVGPECEAIELYPSESRLVDSANQYHLWAIDDAAFRWPIGFDERLVVGPTDGPAKQQPFEEE